MKKVKAISDVQLTVTLQLVDGQCPSKFAGQLRSRMNKYVSKHAKTNRGVDVKVNTEYK